MSHRLITALAFGACLAVGAPAFADILSITGSVNVSSDSVNFYPLASPTGNFNVGPPETGMFSSLTGTSGTIKDIDDFTVGSPMSISSFMTFAAAPNLSFVLTEVEPGTFPTCPGNPAMAGQTCTPAGTPYNLINQTAMSSVGSATVDGYVLDSTTGTETPFVGVFSAQFVNASYQEVIAKLASGGSVNATYSAEFITQPTATPEPGTVFSLFLGGLALTALGASRKRLLARAQK